MEEQNLSQHSDARNWFIFVTIALQHQSYIVYGTSNIKKKAATLHVDNSLKN